MSARLIRCGLAALMFGLALAGALSAATNSGRLRITTGLVSLSAMRRAGALLHYDLPARPHAARGENVAHGDRES